MIVHKVSWKLRKSVKAFYRDHGAMLAAALAFYGVISLFPFLLFLSIILEALVSQQVLISFIQNNLSSTPEIASTLVSFIHGGGSRSAAGIFSLAVFLFGASAFFSHINHILRVAWKIPTVKKSRKGEVASFFTKRATALLLMIVLTILIIISTGASFIISAFSQNAGFVSSEIGKAVLTIMNQAVVLAVFSFFLYLLFTVWMDFSLKTGKKKIYFGALFITFLLFIGQVLIGLYFRYFLSVRTTGMWSSLIALLLFVYYSSIVFVFGIEFTYINAKNGS